MARNYSGFVRQRQQALAKRAENLLRIPSRKVSSPNRSGEQSVSCEQESLWSEVQADAALGMTRCVQYFGGQTWQTHLQSVVSAQVGRRDLGSRNAQPACLRLHHCQQGQIVLV